MKKVVLGIMLMFLWINMLALAFYIQSVKADAKTIYVETCGFCRICIPHAFIEPEIAVIIDDGLTEVLI